jgi:cytochrome c biogenesis protein CcdA
MCKHFILDTLQQITKFEYDDLQSKFKAAVDMDMDINLFGALVAGLLSFASPCVLPLVPPYLCFLAGTSINELSEENMPAQPGAG